MSKMLVNRATNLVREPLSRPIRHGKTHRDHANGNPQRNHERKLARAEWQKNKTASPELFPV